MEEGEAVAAGSKHPTVGGGGAVGIAKTVD